MKVKTLTAHANIDGAFQDPENDNVWFLTGTETHTKSTSHFLVPELSRHIYIPENVQITLLEEGLIFETGKVKHFPKYRGIWGICPFCHGDETCASVLLDKTDIAVGHCINEEKYTFSDIKEDDYLDSNVVFYDFDEKRIDDE